MSNLNSYNNGIILHPPPWTHAIPEGRHHAEALRGIVITSSMLKEFRQCPAHYQALVTGRELKKETVACRFGRAVHILLLQGEELYRRSFIVGGPVNETTGRSFHPGSQTFERWLEETGLDPRRVLTQSEAADIDRIRAAALRHPEIGRLLSRGWAERSAEAELAGLPCRSRMDWLVPGGDIVDLKTTADITRFEADARRFGYLHQFAFYRDVARAAGAEDPQVSAVVLEKRAPYRAGVWTFPAAVLDPYSAQNHADLLRLRACREENRWPTGYERSRTFPPAGIPPLWLN